MPGVVRGDRMSRFCLQYLWTTSGVNMAKGYWVSCYRKINNADQLAAYAKLAGPAIQAGGGRFVVRGMADKAYEQGVVQRTVVVEFDSLKTAHAVHDGPA